LKELETRYDYARPGDRDGVDETCRIDRTMHSLFGASKAAADLAAQEYGRYFNMKVGVFRGGCLTGPVSFSGGVAWILVVPGESGADGRALRGLRVQGQTGARQIHSYDVVRAIEEFAANPRPGEVYNMGGGRENSISILEAIIANRATNGRKLDWRYVEEARKGDHKSATFPICRKFQSALSEMER